MIEAPSGICESNPKNKATKTKNTQFPVTNGGNMSSNYSLLYGRKNDYGPFFTIELSSENPEFENRDYEELSRDKGEIIYIAEQENVGFIHYEHWSDGKLLRRLKYNSDYFWLCAEGEPENWELNTLFSPETLAKTLSAYDADTHEQILAAWNKKNPQEGDMFPILELINIIGDLRKHWNLSDEKFA